MRAEQRPQRGQRRRRQRDPRIDDGIADDVAELAVEVESRGAGGDLPASTEGAPRFGKGQHIAGDGVDEKRHGAPAAANGEPGRQRASGRVAVVGARGNVVDAGFGLEVEVEALVREANRRVLAADREHLEATGSAVFRLAQAPVAQAVGTPLEIGLAVAQDEQGDHRPALAQAQPRKYRRRRIEGGERAAAVGPRRVVDSHATKVHRRLQGARERHPHGVEMDGPVRAGRQPLAHHRRQPPRVQQQCEHDQGADGGEAAARDAGAGRRRRHHRARPRPHERSRANDGRSSDSALFAWERNLPP